MTTGKQQKDPRSSGDGADIYEKHLLPTCELWLVAWAQTAAYAEALASRLLGEMPIG